MNTQKIQHLACAGGAWGKCSIHLLLIAMILITYRQVFSFGFLNYDTSIYVTNNVKVLAGITPENIKWSLLTNFFSNWHPLTWLSHMLDVDLWGMHPAGHHATNLLFHILNTLLIFALFEKTTAKRWESALLAGLFALHPLHIESVAWIAERKDVLSTFFFLLSLHSYINYVRVQNLTRYMVVLLLFTLALMSKPMVVTFPFVLLLFDYWPLGRCNSANDDLQPQQNQITSNPIISILLEKIPFFILAAIGSWLTLIAQKASMANMEVLSLPMRLANALTAYLDYIVLTFWPVKLAVIYPHPGMPPLANVLSAICIIATVTFLGIIWCRTRPWLLFGWLWFLGTLVPVIGIVQVGHQAMADRYTYIPDIGFFLMIVWGLSAVLQYLHVTQRVIACIAISSLLCCSVMTQYQLRFWQNDTTLFQRAIDVTGDNYVAETNLGNSLLADHKLNEAEKHLRRAVQINPQLFVAYTDLGRVCSLEGKSQEAIENYNLSLKLSPHSPETSFMTQFSLAREYEKIGRHDEALIHYKKAIELIPKNIPANMGAGKLLLKIKRPDEALFFFQHALSIDPSNRTARKEIEDIEKERYKK